MASAQGVADMDDPRPIDFDKYRAIAAQERTLAIQQAIDRLVAWLASCTSNKAPSAPRANAKQPAPAAHSLLPQSTKVR
jgi:hypothetical protein